MRSWAGRIAAILAVVLAGCILGIVSATISFGRGDRICKGVSVLGVNVGGLTKAKASQVLQAWARDKLNGSVTLTALDTRWTGAPAAFGARIDWRKAVDEAFSVGRRGGIFERARCVVFSGGKKIEAGILLDPSQAKRAFAKVARAVNRPHKDARMRVEDGHLLVSQDECGIKLNEDKAVRTMACALQAGDAVIKLPVETDQPEVTSRDVALINTMLARFTTTFNPGKVGRTHNLTLAAKSLNGCILKPGDEFSVNQTVGPRLVERGFRTAQIFVKGKLEDGIGGGVCQVSSTLYNSVLLADLKVIERHPHSRTVPYVRPGRDATVAYPARDFRFENSNSSPICVITRVGGARLTVEIYGSATDKKNIQVYTSGARRTGAGRTTIVDSTLRPGQKKTVDKGSSGVSVTVFRKILNTDGSASTEIVSRDRYAAQNSVVAVGPAQKKTSETALTPTANQITGVNPAHLE